MSKPLNSPQDKTSSFIEKARKVHGDCYDYSCSNYINANTKIEIICEKHGKFSQLPRKHLSGQRCPECAKSVLNEDRKLSQSEYIKRAKEKHGDKYDYSKCNYINSLTKVAIICKEHGLFWQAPHAHTRGSGCPKCSSTSSIHKNVTNNEEFNKVAKEINGGKYSYIDDFEGLSELVSVICPVHGPFKIKAYKHLKGHGCMKCNYDNNRTRVKNPSIFREKAEKHYKDLDFSSTDFTKRTIIVHCTKHGKLIKNRDSFLAGGDGCKECAYEQMASQNRRPPEAFVELAKKLHNGFYNYDLKDYKNQNSSITIICPKHGEFSQTPKHHLRGQGCPNCKTSAGQLEILNFLEEHYKGEILLNDRSCISPYEIDLYIKDIKVGIEFHGNFYHSYNRSETTKEKLRHSHKADCASNIKLYQFYESEWYRKQDIVKSMILNAIGYSSRIMARKCEIKQLSFNEYKDTLLDWHISGYKSAEIRLGLFNDGEIVSVLGMVKHKQYQWEIARFASKLGYIVNGGFSKLFSHFVKTAKPTQVMTFADRRFSKGNCYLKNGFVLDSITKPNYYYTKGLDLYSRVKFQKHKLKDLLPVFEESLTESENMFSNGYRRIWDAGHYKLLWSRIS